MRLFFAISLPEGVRRALSALETDLGDARWVPAGQLHLTLRFIGELDDRRAAELVAATTQRAAWPRMTLRVRGVGVFGAPSRARVLWSAIEPVDGVRAIAESLEACAREIGLAPESRPLHPHVTLARFKRPRPDRVRAFLAEHASFATEPFDVGEVVLYRSTLSSKGATHDPHARFALR